MKGELFKPDPNLPADHFDVVIIGSGMGGLTAALLLLREGFKVCVLEQHYRPGGCLHRFFRKRIPFDTGFHYLGGLDDGGTLNQYLKFLGVRDRISIHHLDPDGFDVLRFPGYEFKVPAGWPAFVRRLNEEFPNEKHAISRFAEACQEICRESFAYSFTKPKEDEVGRYAAVTLGGFLRSLEASERLRAVLCGQSFLYGVAPEATPLELHAHVVDSMLQGPAGVDGGGEALAQVMVKAIREHGGVVRTRTPVTALEMKDGKISAAHVAKGDPVQAHMFISNAHPHHTLDLLPPGAFKPAYVNRVRDMKNGIACIAGYFLSDAVEAPKRNCNIYINPSFDIDHTYRANAFGAGHTDEKAVFVTFPSDREKVWPFPRMVLSLGIMPWDEVSRFSASKTKERGEEYEAVKRRHGADLQRAIEAYLPDHAGHLKIADLSTPLTNRDYTRTAQGAMYGLEHSVDRWGKYALGTRTKIPNLLLTGHSVLMPGVVGVTIGAFITCSYLLGFEQIFDRVARA
ncbi:MAG: NAD(P)/FAD-dependent oxidoreductase [Archangiaceae bacterium]|nr:NAD(P)/FAD-dependent oxidoreductase [Archangiaceae bacterium]